MVEPVDGIKHDRCIISAFVLNSDTAILKYWSVVFGCYSLLVNSRNTMLLLCFLDQ